MTAMLAHGSGLQATLDHLVASSVLAVAATVGVLAVAAIIAAWYLAGGDRV